MSKINDYLKTAILCFICIQVAPIALKSLRYQLNTNLETKNKIGSIYITDSIENSSKYRKYLTDYFQDHSIKAILLCIESGGGAAGSCQALAFDIENLKKEYPKPIVTYTENMCASGAYEIAAATDYIVATGSAIIGSIGARMMPIFKLQELLQQYHISCEEITTGSCKNALSNFHPLTPEQRLMLQALTDNTYQQLSKEIACKRHLQLNKIEQWGCGKVFTGLQAYDLKLVDAIGSKTTAINLIKKNIIPSDRQIEWITPSTRHSFFGLLTNDDEFDENNFVQTSYSWDSCFHSFFKQLHIFFNTLHNESIS